jgi:protein-S-isoprenylcysteine O-methyltransferase Ste14
MKDTTDAAKVKFFPPGIPLLAIAAGYILDRYIPLPLDWPLPAPERYYVGGSFIAGVILLLGLWPVLLFKKDGQSANPWRPTPSIEERGPFRITRNPMYLQMVLVCLGVGIASANAWTIVLTPAVAWCLWQLAIKPEERYLEKKFGREYLDYKSRVRRWL